LFKPLWALAGVALLGVAGTATAIVATSGGGEEEVVQAPSETPAASTPADESSAPTQAPAPSPAACSRPDPLPEGTELWRWADISFLLDTKTGVYPDRGFADKRELPPDGGPMVRFIRDDTSDVVIDARTGGVLREQVHEKDAPFINDTLASVCVEGPPDLKSLPWPYSDIEPDKPESAAWNLIYWEPDPSTGIQWFHTCGVGQAGSGCYVGIENERSKRVL
jgi:hypothetical protein